MDRRRATAAMLALTLVPAALAQPVARQVTLEVGSPFPSLVAADAHERDVPLPGAARLVLFAPDRAAASLVQTWLAGQPTDTLPQRGAIYLADISRMPSLVTRMFALPALRELGHPVALVRDSEALRALPRREGQVALIWVQDGRIARLGWAGDPASLAVALAAPTT